MGNGNLCQRWELYVLGSFQRQEGCTSGVTFVSRGSQNFVFPVCLVKCYSATASQPRSHRVRQGESVMWRPRGGRDQNEALTSFADFSDLCSFFYNPSRRNNHFIMFFTCFVG